MCNDASPRGADRERKGGGGGLKFSREDNAINNRGGVVRFSVTPQQASRRWNIQGL